MEVGKVRIDDSKEGRGKDKKVIETGETGDLAELESAPWCLAHSIRIAPISISCPIPTTNTCSYH